MNTTKKGAVRYIVFKEKDSYYAVGLEFNIVESGDNPKVALNNLFDAMEGYLESYKKVGGSRLAPLNQKTDPEYESLWEKIQSNKKIPSPIQINNFGVMSVR